MDKVEPVVQNKMSKEFRPIVQYDKEFPKLFDLGDLEAKEANVIYAILGEIRDRYSPDGVVIPYKDIAYMSDFLLVDKDGNHYARTGIRFNRFIEKVQQKLKSVSYKKFLSMKDGKEIYDDIPLFTDRFRVNHADETLTVHISESVLQEEVINELGEVVQPQKTVVDLFNNDDWSETQYLKFGRELHNKLNKYAQNLYRWISGYRGYGYATMDAYNFETTVMKFITPTAKKNRLNLLKKAVGELQELTYDGVNKVFDGLTYEIVREKRKIIRYNFSFKKFSIDLNYIKQINGNNIVFDVPQNATVEIPDSHNDYALVYQKFIEVFSADPVHNNPHNIKNLKHYTTTLSSPVVVAALEKTAMDRRRGVGWFLRLLENWEKNNVKEVSDIEKAEAVIFNKKTTSQNNVPEWSDSNYENTTSEEEKKRLEDAKKVLLKKLKN